MSDDQAANRRELAEKALAMKEANANVQHHPETGDHASEGIQSTPRPDYPPTGALDAEGQRPVLERSRKVR